MFTQQEAQTLYERLGGLCSIAVVVGGFIDLSVTIDALIDLYNKATEEVQYVV